MGRIAVIAGSGVALGALSFQLAGQAVGEPDAAAVDAAPLVSGSASQSADDHADDDHDDDWAEDRDDRVSTVPGPSRTLTPAPTPRAPVEPPAAVSRAS